MIRCFLPVNHPDNRLQAQLNTRVICRLINQPVNPVFTRLVSHRANRLDNQLPPQRCSLPFDPVLNQLSFHLDSRPVFRLLSRADNHLAVHLHNPLDNQHRLLQDSLLRSHLIAQLDNHPLCQVFNRSLVQLRNPLFFLADNPVVNRLRFHQLNQLVILPVNPPRSPLPSPLGNHQANRLPNHPLVPPFGLLLGHLHDPLNSRLHSRFLHQHLNQYVSLVANRLVSLPRDLLPSQVINHRYNHHDNRHRLLQDSLLRSHLIAQLDNHPLCQVFNRSLVQLLNPLLFQVVSRRRILPKVQLQNHPISHPRIRPVHL
jgi:hypothetical protein